MSELFLSVASFFFSRALLLSREFLLVSDRLSIIISFALRWVSSTFSKWQYVAQPIRLMSPLPNSVYDLRKSPILAVRVIYFLLFH